MTPETLERPRPAIAPADIEEALGKLGRSPYVFRRLGQIWVLKFEGKMVLMGDARGLYYLARLLAQPDRIVPAVSLLAAVAGIDPRITQGGSGSLLDDEAVATYRTRYNKLEEQLDDAQVLSEPERAAQIEVEMKALEAELARAIGLGKKTRKQSDADRVRKSVSMAVSRAIDSIAAEFEVFGKHLNAFIVPGSTFRYAPDRRIDWLT